MSAVSEFDQTYATEQLRRSRHPLRRLIKHFYLENILRNVRGATIDFGCGAGQLLRRLPAGSIGLEVNASLVAALRTEGLDVAPYDPEQDQLRLEGLQVGRYRTFVMAHVLEHIDDSAAALRQIFQSCARLGVERVIIIVPGAKGFDSDATHKTFVNRRYVQQHHLLNCEGYAMKSIGYFPGNWEWIGRYFVFHEFFIVYDREV